MTEKSNIKYEKGGLVDSKNSLRLLNVWMGGNKIKWSVSNWLGRVKWVKGRAHHNNY